VGVLPQCSAESRLSICLVSLVRDLPSTRLKVSLISQKLSKDDGQEGCYQERGHVRGHAARRSGLCHAGAREVQHREGHRGIHKEGV